MDSSLLALHDAAYSLLQNEPTPFSLKPILSIHDPGLRPFTRDFALAALSELENHMNHLDDILWLMRAKKESLRLRRAALKAALAPISSLPQELLRHIFALAVESASTAHVATWTALAISHTSSAWRAAALSQSAIWARADFQGFHQSLAKLWVERSRHRPLSLTLHSANVGLGTILGHVDAQRLTHLEVSDEDDEGGDVPGRTVVDQLNSLADVALPALETLWIQSTHSGTDEIFTDIDVNALHLVVPAVKDLRLFGVCINTFASLGRRLTSLHMESVFGLIPEWLEIIASCPLLETLVIINGVSLSSAIGVPAGPSVMVHLHTLAIQDCDNTTVYTFLDNLEAPNLVEFIGDFCEDVDEPEDPELSLNEGGEISDELCFQSFPSFVRTTSHRRLVSASLNPFSFSTA